MQTNIHPDLAELSSVKEADDILRSCVHCGFCTATCPTYQLLGDELDGPRGRIYLIKNMLEDDGIDERSMAHLDRCLTCRSCETTCPSGVQYGRLLDIARDLASTRSSRSVLHNVVVGMMRLVFPRPGLLGPLVQLGQLLKPVLPAFVATRVPVKQQPIASVSVHHHDKTVVLLQGCVQQAATPNVNRAVSRLLDTAGFSVECLPEEGCCGAVDYHLGAHEAGKERMRALIDQLYPRLDDIEAIVSSASGCGVTIKEYQQILSAPEDAAYAARARAVVEKVVDVSELFSDVEFSCRPTRVAVHTPCSLQHGQRIIGAIEDILRRSGIELVAVAEGHLCCGSAGTYSITQPVLSGQLRERKLLALQGDNPDVVVTANIGCQLHLQSGTDTRVMHWAELVVQQLDG
jgi:glycolate oxidase iron-sulfur subunit